MGAAFLSTIIPGVLLTVVYVGLNFLFLRKVKTITVEERVPARVAARRVGTTGAKAFWALLLPVFILGSIYSGIATPTEAAAIAFVYTVVVGFVFYRGLTLQNFPKAIGRAAVTTGSIIAVLFFLFVMSRAMILEQVPKDVADALIALTENRIFVLLMINLILLLIGMIVDDVSGSVLAAIVLLPVATEIGVHPIHFAAIVRNQPRPRQRLAAVRADALHGGRHQQALAGQVCRADHEAPVPGPPAHGPDRHLHPGPLPGAPQAGHGNRVSGSRATLGSDPGRLTPKRRQKASAVGGRPEVDRCGERFRGPGPLAGNSGSSGA